MELIIWLDKVEAKVFHLLGSGVRKQTIRRAGFKIEAHGAGEDRFYNVLCQHLEKFKTAEWFVSGDGPAKDGFVNHLRSQHPGLFSRIKAVQKIDYLTDAQIIDHGMRYFRRAHTADNSRAVENSVR